MATARTFWASFLDGFTISGIFGQSRIPGEPATIFSTPAGHDEDLDSTGEEIIELKIAPGTITAAEVIRLKQVVQRVVDQETQGRASVQSRRLPATPQANPHDGEAETGRPVLA